MSNFYDRISTMEFFEDNWINPLENKKPQDTRVLVGISGGVDSAVCALMLKQAGYNVTGAMMKIYDGEIKTIANSCYGTDKEKEIKDAKTICKKLGIDFHLIDCSKAFDELVFSKFKSEYKNGRTPNPCVLCNPNIKFGVFPTLAKKAGIEFDKFATGHYARIEYDKQIGKYLLRQGINQKKDQTYFLYKLTQEKLQNILFPLGNLEKDEVRKIAKENGLIVHDKTDSQDFYKGDYAEIINAKEIQGKIVHISGKVLGLHNGIFNYTIGQRKGLKIAHPNPLYVIELDSKTNTVIVAEKEYTYSKRLIASDISWTYFNKDDKKSLPPKIIQAEAKIRSAGQKAKCEIILDNLDTLEYAKIEFKEPQNAITPGQAIVFYNNDIVLGGGTIEKTID